MFARAIPWATNKGGTGGILDAVERGGASVIGRPRGQGLRRPPAFLRRGRRRRRLWRRGQAGRGHRLRRRRLGQSSSSRRRSRRRPSSSKSRPTPRRHGLADLGRSRRRRSSRPSARRSRRRTDSAEPFAEVGAARRRRRDEPVPLGSAMVNPALGATVFGVQGYASAHDEAVAKGASRDAVDRAALENMPACRASSAPSRSAMSPTLSPKAWPIPCCASAPATSTVRRPTPR